MFLARCLLTALLWLLTIFNVESLRMGDFSYGMMLRVTYTLEPGETMCFYEHFEQNQIINAMMKIVENAETPIEAEIKDPFGEIMESAMADEMTYDGNISVSGDHSFCLSSISPYRKQRIDLHLIGYDFQKFIEHTQSTDESTETFERIIVKMRTVFENVMTTNLHLRHSEQHWLKDYRSVLSQETYIQLASSVLCTAMFFSAAVQVTLIRRMFADQLSTKPRA